MKIQDQNTIEFNLLQMRLDAVKNNPQSSGLTEKIVRAQRFLGDVKDLYDIGIEESNQQEISEALKYFQRAREQVCQLEALVKIPIPVKSDPEKPKRSFPVLLPVLLSILAGGFVFVVRNQNKQKELEDLAHVTCGQLEGAPMFTLPSLINGAVAEAENLGFSGPDLGDQMREDCPLLMRQLDNL